MSIEQQASRALAGANTDDSAAEEIMAKAKKGSEPRIKDARTHPRRFVGLAVAADYLSVTAKTLSKWLDGGLLEHVVFNGRRKIEVIELVAFVERQRIERKAS